MTTKRQQWSWAIQALRRGLGKEPDSIEIAAAEAYHEAVLHSMDPQRRGLRLVIRSAQKMVEIILKQDGENVLKKAHTYDHELE